MVQREFTPSLQESFFLFGARGTGKSTWLQQMLGRERCFWIDLLDPDQEDRYLRDPKALEAELELLSARGERPSWVVVDEVQKAPRLLDVVHRLIERERFRFALTGSSARKLKRGHANLLGGRADLFSLYPFTYRELGKDFDLGQALDWGTLPKVHLAATSAERIRRLRSYCQTYLKEEVLIEQLVRNLVPFKGFLEVSAQMHGKRLNFEAIARDIGVDNKTVQAYVDILEETHLGTRLPSFHASIRKSQRQAPKFFWFDGGVQRFLSGTVRSPLVPSTSSYGDAFEAFLINELIRYNSYRELDYRFAYLETRHGSEIDLILSRGKEHVAIEIKSTRKIDAIEVRKLEALAADIPGAKRIYYLSQDSSRRKIGRVTCLPWREIFKELA